VRDVPFVFSPPGGSSSPPFASRRSSPFFFPRLPSPFFLLQKEKDFLIATGEENLSIVTLPLLKEGVFSFILEEGGGGFLPQDEGSLKRRYLFFFLVFPSFRLSDKALALPPILRVEGNAFNPPLFFFSFREV